MTRRETLALSPAALAVASGAAVAEKEDREYYELRQYRVANDEQKAGLLEFLGEAAVPAWNRAGVKPVGVFVQQDGNGPVYVLLPHQSLDSVTTLTARLLADDPFRTAGADFLAGTRDAPRYQSVASSLLKAFQSHPRVATPATGPDRVFQLRTYESPSVLTGQKKIEMFNTAEIAIFKQAGLNPVFFGEALVGDRLPNLTYMVGFNNDGERDAAWKSFRDSPAWKELRSRPEYADKKIIRAITNLVVVAAECSQI